MIDDRAYYSILEFAEKLGVHPNTIRRAIKNGHICAFKVGKGMKSSYRIAHTELERLPVINMEDIIKQMKED